MNQQSKQRGQVLVLIILAIAAIFGFAALAVDIGRTYSERRRAQSAADAAAYAAAFASTQSNNPAVPISAGLTSVSLNGFNDTNAGEDLSAEMDVQIYNPPHSGKYATATETINPNEYFQVIIRLDVDPVFSQFIYQGPMELTVEAIARGTSSNSFADGASIVATCPDCCDAVTVRGDANIQITDGSIISNSTKTGATAGCDSAQRSGSPCITVTNGSIITGGNLNPGNATCKINNVERPAIIGTIDDYSENIWGSPDPGTPSCAGLSEVPGNGIYSNVGTEPGLPHVLSPGIYPKGISISGVQSVVSLEPGMYCLDGDLDVSSGSITGDGVMFVMRQMAPNKPSSVSITTSSPVILSAPGDEDGDQEVDEGECIEDGNYATNKICWSGFLVLMPYDNKGTVHFGGGNTTNYQGTVYAPGPPKTGGAKCTVVGSSGILSLDASLICYTVEIGGSGTINIRYDSESDPPTPSIVEMSK